MSNGAKMNVPIARTSLSEEEIQSVLGPLRSGWLVQGPKVREFEEKWSAFTGARHSIAVIGDGAMNAGQVFESFNMAALWQLPVVFVIDPALPADIHTITLSYSFFEVAGTAAAAKPQS